MWMEKLPKIELHCHLDGSLPPIVLKNLCEQGKIEIPNDDEDFQKLIQVNKDCKSLSEYLKAFHLPLEALKNEDTFFQASYAVLQEASKEGVRYMELRFAPLLSETEQLSGESIIEACAEGAKRAKQDFGIESGILLCGMRHFDEKKNEKNLMLAKKYYGHGVCGIDLAGDESAFQNELFEEYFKKAGRLEIPFTIHAGECGRKENIRLAAEYGARRIGHGIAMKGDSFLQEEIKEKGIGIELCPSSNLQTKAVRDWKEYPFDEFYSNDVKVSVNTDNRTVTGTTMTKELSLLEEKTALKKRDIPKIMKDSIIMSFAEESVKKAILEEIEKWEKE